MLLNRFNKENILEREWITGLLILSLSQLIDIQNHEGRIRIIFWLFLSGASNMLIEVDKSSKQNSVKINLAN